MSEMQFSKNFGDLSIQSGARAGFQFEFYCERCQDTWRSSFSPFLAAQGADWLNRASGFLGGVIGGANPLDDAGNALGGVGEAKWGEEHDKAFMKAFEEAKTNFHRCPQCVGYVCDRCWNGEAGLCRNCAPSAEVAAEAAFAAGKVQAVSEKAALEGIHEGKHMDVKQRAQLVCPDCNTETNGAKFCPNCGKQMATKKFCIECGAALPAPTAKFCGECGAGQAPPAE
ncbi:MAG: zinc ribbon domain-containing protein [Coriobacteriia bacterium]|nr:zinc ribbon domain-containing protein [Coriobacteriia bacterium]